MHTGKELKTNNLVKKDLENDLLKNSVQQQGQIEQQEEQVVKRNFMDLSLFWKNP